MSVMLATTNPAAAAAVDPNRAQELEKDLGTSRPISSVGVQ